MKIISCNDEKHGEAILAIFNEDIVNSTALYDYKPRTKEMMAAWFENKAKGKFPVFGAESEAGELMGFSTYGSFRGFPGYKYTVEHSVYVDTRFRAKGLGKILLREIITAAEAQNYHVMIGVIDSANATSIRLHEALGFTCSGTIRQSGFKFGRWLDVVLYQLILPTPAEPNEL